MGAISVPKLEDYGLLDTNCGFTMGETDENLTEKYDIFREEVDKFAFRSQQCASEARDKGYFIEEIAPVTVKSTKS